MNVMDTTTRVADNGRCEHPDILTSNQLVARLPIQVQAIILKAFYKQPTLNLSDSFSRTASVAGLISWYATKTPPVLVLR